jgi:hypothetical protein
LPKSKSKAKRQKKSKKQNYLCKACGRQFTGDHALCYKGYLILNEISNLLLEIAGIRIIRNKKQMETETIKTDNNEEVVRDFIRLVITHCNEVVSKESSSFFLFRRRVLDLPDKKNTVLSCCPAYKTDAIYRNVPSSASNRPQYSL